MTNGDPPYGSPEPQSPYGPDTEPSAWQDAPDGDPSYASRYPSDFAGNDPSAPGRSGALYPPPTSYGTYAAYAPPLPYNGFAIASLVTGILGGTFPLAIVFGFVALSQIKRDATSGRALAVAGIVLGFAWLALFAFVMVLTIVIVEGNTG